MGLLAGLLGLGVISFCNWKPVDQNQIKRIEEQKARTRAEYDRINKRHRDDLRAMGYEVADDFEIVHYCG